MEKIFKKQCQVCGTTEASPRRDVTTINVVVQMMSSGIDSTFQESAVNAIYHERASASKESGRYLGCVAPG